MYSAAVLASLVAVVAGHGFVNDPPARRPGDAYRAACGEQPFNQQSADINGNVQGIQQVAGFDLSAADCNLWLCKGFQFDDNADNVQQFALGQEIPFDVTIAAPHTGFANVSVVSTAGNAVIGVPLIEFDNYASNNGLDANNSAFSVTMPDDLGGACTTAGECVLQWFWDAPDIDQTYEACVDFTVGGGGSNPPASSSAATAAGPSSTAQSSAAEVTPEPTTTLAPSSSVSAVVTSSSVQNVTAPAPTATSTPAPVPGDDEEGEEDDCPAEDEDEEGDDEEGEDDDGEDDECPVDDGEEDDGEDDECPVDDGEDEGDDEEVEEPIEGGDDTTTPTPIISTVEETASATNNGVQPTNGGNGGNNGGSASTVTQIITVTANPTTVTVTAQPTACTQ